MIPKEQLEWFDCFWAIYWRKVAKKDAFRAFHKQVTSEEIFAAVMDGVRLQHRHMMKREPEFRPHAGTWLRGERWSDVMDIQSGGYRPYSARPELQLQPYCGEYVTLPLVPTVPAGPTADEWRKRNS